MTVIEILLVLNWKVMRRGSGGVAGKAIGDLGRREAWEFSGGSRDEGVGEGLRREGLGGVGSFLGEAGRWFVGI